MKNLKRKILAVALCATIALGIKHGLDSYLKKNPYKFYDIDKNNVISMIDDGFETTNSLPSLSSFVPQGIALSDEYIFVSLYDSYKRNESIIYVLNYDYELINTVSLDCFSHVGGISFDNENNLLWVSGTHGSIRAYNVEDLISKEKAEATFVDEEIGKDLINFRGEKSISYLTIYNGKLYVGSFTLLQNTKMKVYDIENQDGIKLTYLDKIMVPSKVQGVTFFEKNNKEYVAFSRSYGSDFDSFIQIYKFDEDFDCDNDECVTVRLRPMLEQIIADSDGTLYTVFESNARLYSDGSIYNDINSFDAGTLIKK